MTEATEAPTLSPVTLDQVPESMKAAMQRAGWTSLMPVQAQSIPYLMEGKDVMIQSRTGSGKTGGFVLPIIERLDYSKTECQALVLVPTRELAKQVSAEATLLAGDSGLRVVPVYGGVGYKEQMQGFKDGAHLVVGTPGRILDHLLRDNLNLDGLEMLVFDEADRMLSMGFLPDMHALRGYLPDKPLTGAMFSATFPPHVIGLARQFLNDAETISLSRDNVHVTEIEHAYYPVPAMGKDRSLVKIIEQVNPTNAIIFCNTKNKTHYVSVVLQRFGYDADELSSDLNQNARERVLKRVHEGKLRFLVATDVAARGIDIPDLSHVIQFEPPQDMEAYIHRAGRTGRAGASGEAITLASPMESCELKRIAKKYQIDLVERALPSDEELQTIVAERAVAMLETQLRKRDSIETERMQRFLPLAKQIGESEDELAVIAMLLDDFYQKALHAPVEPVAKPVSSDGSSSRGSSGGKSGGGKNRKRRGRGRGRRKN